MALDGTYAGLLASVADFLNRADLTATVPDFVTLAEAQMNRELRVRRMVVSATVASGISNEFESVPVDFAGPVSMTLSDGRALDQYTTDNLAQRKMLNASTPGEPMAYAVVGGQFQFFPAPDSTYYPTLIYYQKIPSLAANGGNWLLSDHPDAYLYGALTQSAPYLQDDARVAVWGSLFTKALDDIQAADASTYGARLTPQPSPSQII